ncbi:MAG: 4-alpha-glucanotransferase [Anaerolineales bacterium]
MTREPRRSGILLHPTSLPTRFAIGDLGPAAQRWIRYLAGSQQSLWQILPLGPTGYGDSPYQSLSAFAGNPLLISPEHLERDGLLGAGDLDHLPYSSPGPVDYARVIAYQGPLLGQAFENFKSGKGRGLKPAFESFRHSQGEWLEDFSLFMALKQENGGLAWGDWPPELRLRQARALQVALQRNAYRVEANCFLQFLFFRQWEELKSLARENGIRIIGDVPIFLAYDSADVWAHPELFKLDEAGRPLVVAGVPPDYFSRTGQLWGNPLYRWDQMKDNGYRWWIQRLHAALRTCDLVRLDHFRGFEAAWEVPSGETTAERGEWVKGPGAELFQALRSSLGSLPLIAEDLGLITPAVESLRKQFGLPGMRVLQFAFQGGPANSYLPHNYERDTVVYTGTHDNDTTRGWYASAPEPERDFVRRYLGTPGTDIAWDLIRLGWESMARMAVVPLPDVLDLGSEARMNFPGRLSGNWRWRVGEELLTPQRQEKLAELTQLYGRSNTVPESGQASAAN